MSKNITKVAEKIVLKGPPNLDFILKRSLEEKKDEFCNGKISPIAILASSLQRFFPYVQCYIATVCSKKC